MSIKVKELGYCRNHLRSFIAKDDGIFPGSRLPVLHYIGALEIEKSANKSVEQEVSDFVAPHGWRVDWTGVIYKSQHYHSTAHEGLVVTAGSAGVEIGGPKRGARTTILPGDVVILPAGVVHKCISRSDDFEVVGMYPFGQMWDMCRGKVDRNRAVVNISHVPLPSRDPIFGNKGLLQDYWK